VPLRHRHAPGVEVIDLQPGETTTV
jgi:hypothetical protein